MRSTKNLYAKPCIGYVFTKLVTLYGLSHNMHASTMLSPEELKDPSVVAENGMCNTVMEYPAINFARNKEDQTLFYDDNPGPYDYCN